MYVERIIMYFFGLEPVKVIFGSCGALFSKLGCNSKTAHRRAKQTKFEPRGHMTYAFGNFDLQHVKIVQRLGSYLLHLSQNWALTREWLIIELIDKKCTSGGYEVCTWVRFT